MNAAGVHVGLGNALDAFCSAMPLALAGLCVLLGAAGLTAVAAEAMADRRRDGQLADGAVPSSIP